MISLARGGGGGGGGGGREGKIAVAASERERERRRNRNWQAFPDEKKRRLFRSRHPVKSSTQLHLCSCWRCVVFWEKWVREASPILEATKVAYNLFIMLSMSLPV